eukprot:TRINITY_DN74968_c0_g1_i1.p1 TRINITY_DN74968_c0_g1~~TRINITY_DN74968_c0_g1_i1.p1  ORF type:complete len:134 (-),score=8.38 TRINITY_DN74968_c0_g1_i1:30-431(-)
MLSKLNFEKASFQIFSEGQQITSPQLFQTKIRFSQGQQISIGNNWLALVCYKKYFRIKELKQLKKLSTNEKKALELTAKGFKNKDIAKQMTDRNGNQLSEKTISTYIRRVRSKLGISLDKKMFENTKCKSDQI